MMKIEIKTVLQEPGVVFKEIWKTFAKSKKKLINPSMTNKMIFVLIIVACHVFKMSDQSNSSQDIHVGGDEVEDTSEGVNCSCQIHI